METEVQSLKRKREENDEETNVPVKRYTSDCDSVSSVPEYSRNEDTCESDTFIDCLSEDVMLTLLSFVEPTDLVNFSRCNRRFYRICSDKTLWQRLKVFCDGKEPAHGSLQPFLNAKTVSLCFIKKANDKPQGKEDECFSDQFFHRLSNLINLKHLSVENHQLSSKQLTLKYLPESITELKLSGTQLISSSDRQIEFFNNVGQILPNLRLVDVSYCQWFIPYSLVALAKCRHLRVLRMVGCQNLKEFIPYAGIACYYGFPNLETLDLRLTNVVDREVGCFNRIKSLKHIYLENPANEITEEDSESITDLCTTALGRRNVKNGSNTVQEVEITRIPSDGGDASEHTLETLVIRNYPKITDITLKHAQKCLKSLKFLDITGSSCSAEQIAHFRAHRPDVTLVHHEGQLVF